MKQSKIDPDFGVPPGTQKGKESKAWIGNRAPKGMGEMPKCWSEITQTQQIQSSQRDMAEKGAIKKQG